MKNIYSLLLAFVITTLSLAQAPQKMSYQAVIRDASGNLITEQKIGVQISILQGTPDGTAVYTETQTPTTNANGLVSIEIGGEEATAVSGVFSAIDWSAGPYFIKTETDPSGGTDYTITGTSQLLSVPYAFHAKTAETVTGSITETDPVFGASIASGITGTDTTYWNNKLDNYTESDPIFRASVASEITGADITNWNTNKLQQLSVSTSGDTLHLENGGFVIIPGISAANPLAPVFCASGATAIVDITNPTTGMIWMDRNLGAKQVAISSTDADSFGDLYQWGRRSDGHQCRTSTITSTLSSTDQPAHGSFIESPNSPYDWRSPQNTNLWQGVNGVNNPCPSGYRVPTNAELDAERVSWSGSNAPGALASPLKFPLPGYRASGDSSINDVGASGRYWSSTINGANSEYLRIFASSASMISVNRAYGFSVRCIKD